MTKTKSHKRLRAVVYFELFGEMDSTSRVPITVKLITALIIFSVLWIIFETEPGVRHGNEALFDAVNGVIGALFVIEYLLRLWAVGEDSRFVGFQGRVRYIFSFWALIDFIAIAPFLLLLNLDESFLLRIVRLFRILAIFKLGRYSDAIQDLSHAIGRRYYELILALVISGATLIIAATGMYLLEHETQPIVFGSIPRAIWWAVTSFTPMAASGTPMTALGKIFASLSAIAGIAMVAMPTAILAAAFSQVFQERKGQQQKD